MKKETNKKIPCLQCDHNAFLFEKKEMLKDYPPLATSEQEKIINDFAKMPNIIAKLPINLHGSWEYKENEPWIQTYTGRRFTPTNPTIEAIVIEDIVHPLSMQCRFSGHVSKFYSVANHSLLVSHLCDEKDQLWGLLHDASEAYLVDIPRPIKRSGKFDNYLGFEKIMQDAICERFDLEKEMPESVKKADDLLLITEARDLMSPMRAEWGYNDIQPLPFKIIPMTQQESKNAFILRFCELTGISTIYFKGNL